jgi:hypothetical protein
MENQAPEQTFGLAVPRAEVDAGQKYREKLNFKAKARRVWFWIKFWIWMAIIAAVAGVSYLTYNAYTHRVTQVVTDMRPCMVEVGGEKITGVREYQYNYFDLFGMRLIDTDKIEVTTTVEYKGSDLIVVGRDSKGWWSMKTSDGEYGKMKTKPADSYTFITKGGRVKEVASNEFCK